MQCARDVPGEGSLHTARQGDSCETRKGGGGTWRGTVCDHRTIRRRLCRAGGDTLSQGCPQDEIRLTLMGLLHHQDGAQASPGSSVPPEVWHRTECSGWLAEAAAGTMSPSRFSRWEIQATHFRGFYRPCFVAP